MKRLPLLALAACLMAATAQAQSPATTPEPAPAPTAGHAVETAVAAPAPGKTEDKPRLSEVNCIRQTGSRIRQRDTKTVCNGQPGRSYSKDELDRTGHVNLADAIRTLDPSIR
jgi:hypothetical protein